jgi:glycerophosphoryl diester phosphodiesterase
MIFFKNHSIKSILAFSLLVTTLLGGCTHSPILEKDIMKQSTLFTAENRPLVIAHRGASGYAPEHSLVAKAMAHAMDVDYIEQDVVMTKDDHLVVLHDLYLDRVTNVMTAFPTRFRDMFGQKRWLAIDFTLQEIKSLKMSEGFDFDPQSDSMTPLYPNRFPLFKSSFQVSTLEEEIELIQGLNHSTGKDIGIYVEVKAPWLHLMEGKDISLKTLEVLKRYGYTNKQDKAYFQCFDPEETKRVHDELLPSLQMDIKLVQLIAHTDWNETMRLKDGELTPYSYDWIFQQGAMQKVARYADGIGPWMPMLVNNDANKMNITESKLLVDAKANGLAIHPYTFRVEKNKIPEFATDFDNLLKIFLIDLKVDGVFTDQPDKVIDFIEKTKS